MSVTPLQTLLYMARQLLTSTDGEAPDRSDVADTVDTVRPLVERRTAYVFTDDEITGAVHELEFAYAVKQGPAISIVDRHTPPDWYLGDLRKPGPFMSRYLQKLAEDSWPVRSVEELRDSTARVVELLDNPQRPGPWNWRGLVVGDVQSGKTAHYAGVVNRAVDAGYRIVIILAGMHNLLRLQTQQRLELDFLGFDTNPIVQDLGQMRAVGVGTIPPALNVGSLTLASPTGDFNVAFARQQNFAPRDTPCLFVVKKNATILRNLNGWIRKHQDFLTAPLLLIDDEADQASVDTKDQPTLADGSFDEDYDPTRINGEIRKMLKAFERSAYVAYTATPFANILIHDERGAAEYGADLFPSTFIFSLTPPDDYFGPVAVFGTTSDGPTGGLPIIRYVPRHDEAWIPEIHDKTLRPRFEGEDRLPPTLEEAIDAFLISCAVRAARGRPTAHNSMLVHVSRFVDVHDRIHAQVERYLDDVRARISGGDAATRARLKALWDDDFVPTRAAVSDTVFDRGIVDVSWDQVLSSLADSSDRIQVVVSNGRSKTGLDYERYRETGLSVIAIGGDKLSRGLTLEGLTVSYFLRVSKQYDSLLQMGRWFGYRRGFADVCRLYTTADMEVWFRHVATASQDLRAELARMRIMLQTPKDYGLRVEAHSVMGVTAANKRRHAVERRTGFAGEGKVQTVMHTGHDPLERNARVTDQFVEQLGEPERDPPRPTGANASGLLWRNVEGRRVADYLGALSYPPENVEIEAGALSGYVLDQMAAHELTEWTVFLATGEGKTVDVGPHRVSCVVREPLPKQRKAGRYVVKSILNPPDEAIDLSEGEFADALRRTAEARALAGEAPPARPSGVDIRAVRGRRPETGLLILYPLDPQTETLVEWDGLVVGTVVSFPDSAMANRRIYLENSVLQRERARR
ncbi:Z1 domain-containing protein [Sphingopyxis sp. R3-92]|uniref:Z1 domain-containing protein n=1 Tax=Sphingopyxis sp. R3-92 TaxID=3158553 RepID=UPI003EE7F0D8